MSISFIFSYKNDYKPPVIFDLGVGETIAVNDNVDTLDNVEKPN